jgi:hypothetical protein
VSYSLHEKKSLSICARHPGVQGQRPQFFFFSASRPHFFYLETALYLGGFLAHGFSANGFLFPVKELGFWTWCVMVSTIVQMIEVENRGLQIVISLTQEQPTYIESYKLPSFPWDPGVHLVSWMFRYMMT